MASLKQITVGTTSYDIIPSAITDSNANYKASCPTISSDTTVEVASNKTTVINSSSTDTEYPSARAVYTAIKKASKAGTFASNISTSNGSAYVPLVSTSGMFGTTYLENLSIPDNKRMSLTNAGTISTLTLAHPSSGVSGKITKFYLDHGTAIGDSTTSTESDTTLGCNGLYGNGTVYIAATCTKDPTTSPYAFIGSIVNKAGVSSSVQGGYIGFITNAAYATISTLINSGTISTLSLQKATGTAGKITKLVLGDNTEIGDSSEPTSDTTAGQNGLYGNGTVYISATGASDPSTSNYAFKGSIVNKAGVSDSVKGGYISSIRNGSYATIGQIRNVPYSKINEISNRGTITNIANFGSISEILNNGHIVTLKMDGRGTADILVAQGSATSISLGISSTYPSWGVVANGKFCPWQEVSIVENLVTFLSLQTGILYKYTGSTTTYNGVTYTNGNFYRYEA